MFLLLTTCAALTFILGDIEEGAMLSMFVVRLWLSIYCRALLGVCYVTRTLNV